MWIIESYALLWKYHFDDNLKRKTVSSTPKLSSRPNEDGNVGQIGQSII